MKKTEYCDYCGSEVEEVFPTWDINYENKTELCSYCLSIFSPKRDPEIKKTFGALFNKLEERLVLRLGKKE